MAGIKVGMGFERTGAFPIDEALTLTKAQMLVVDDSNMPDKYFCVCLDDGKMYLYDKNATPNAVTGKFSLMQAEGTGYDDTALAARVTANENALSNTYTKDETIAEIEDKLAAFDKLDYKVADAAPTATKVTIGGTEKDVVEGTRYMVKHATDDRYEEYVVLDGKVYDLGPANSSVSAVMASAFTVSNPIGKYVRGANITADTSLEEVLRGILSKTYNPTLTEPGARLSYANMPALAKVGRVIEAGTATATLDRGSIDPQYTAESAYRSGEATGYSIELKNASVPYSDSNVTGQFSVPAFTRDAPGTVELEVTISYGAGVQPKDSDGGNYETALAAGSKSEKISTEFILPFYWGASTTATVADFTGLNEDLTKKTNSREYRITTANSHPVIAFNVTYGELTSILDQNGFETKGGWTKSNVQVDGQTYAVYVHDNATTDTNAKYTFKF